MTTEFPGCFMRLFGGPMWSGQPIENSCLLSYDFSYCITSLFYLETFFYKLYVILLSSASWHFCATAELPLHRNLFFDTPIFLTVITSALCYTCMLHVTVACYMNFYDCVPQYCVHIHL